jgi:citrate synthase
MKIAHFILPTILICSPGWTSEILKKEEKPELIIEFNNKKSIIPYTRDSFGTLYIDSKKISDGVGGAFLHDPGYLYTSSCESKITYIEGDKGILRYRGFPIEQLAEKSTYLETAYLLIYGGDPHSETFSKNVTEFHQDVLQYAPLEDIAKKVISNFPSDTHPMTLLTAGLTALASTKLLASLNLKDTKDRYTAITYLLGQMSGLTSYIYCHINQIDKEEPKIDFDQGYAFNIFNRMGQKQQKLLKTHTNLLDKTLDTILLLHADHEQNASTATVRQIGSTGADLVFCLLGGVAALSGPLHGGANEAVIHMLQEISHKENIEEFLNKVKKKQELLMGFGHRIYKNYDPRAKIISELGHQVLETIQDNSNLMQVAHELEQKALEDNYFIQRKLYPNVDFYSGIILKSFNIPTNMFTVFFALGRLAGWLAHWQEQFTAEGGKIARPRQLYSGEVFKNFPTSKL